MTEIPTFEVGQKVAVYNDRGYMQVVQIATVERVTVTQYVLDNGDRYRRRDLCLVGGLYSAQLLAVDDPRVVETRANRELDQVGHAIERAIRRRERNADPAAVIDDVIRLAAEAREAIAALRAEATAPPT